MRATAPRLAVIGDVALDYSIELDPAGGADEKQLPLSTSRTLGGTAANTAATMHALGMDVSLYANVGDDILGPWIVEAIRRQGIDTSHVRVRSGDSSVATIIRVGDRRTVIVDPGVAVEVPDFDYIDLDACHSIYVSYSPQSVSWLVDHGLGKRVIVGLEAWMLKEQTFRKSLDQCQLVIANQAAFEAASDLGQLPRIPVICTRGPLGASVHQLGQVTVRIPAYKVEVADATGAGDCFAGALLSYLTTGIGLIDATRMAVVAAALSTRSIGAQGFIPTRKEIERHHRAS